jgi:hypothetical protein
MREELKKKRRQTTAKIAAPAKASPTSASHHKMKGGLEAALLVFCSFRKAPCFLFLSIPFYSCSVCESVCIGGEPWLCSAAHFIDDFFFSVVCLCPP